MIVHASRQLEAESNWNLCPLSLGMLPVGLQDGRK